MLYTPTPYHIELIDKKYPGWNERRREAFLRIGETNDMEYLNMIERSYAVIVPYNYVALGAASGGNIDMLSYALSKGNLVSSMGYRLALRAKENGHTHLYELLMLYFGDKIFDVPD